MHYCYQCDATITLTASKALESVTGDHDTGKSNDDVEYLTIKDQYMTFFPEGLLVFFKILQAMSVYNTQLLSLGAKDLQPIPGLLHLAVQRNNLTSIDADLFSFTPLVRLFAADANQIEHIGHNLIANTNELAYLFFGNNVCINQNAQGRSEVLALAPTLSVLCPPLDDTTTQTPTTVTIPSTTAFPTTTIDNTMDVYEKIEELRASNHALGDQIDSLQESNSKQVEEIEELQQSVSEFDERMLEIEKQLKGGSSLPSVHWLSSTFIIASVFCQQFFQ